MFSKKIITLGISATLLFAVVGCGNEEADQNNNVEDQKSSEVLTGDAVAIINGTKISQAEFDQAFNQIKQTYDRQGINLEENEEQLKQAKTNVLDQLINSKLLALTAEENGYESTEAEITENLEQITNQFPSEKELNAALEANNMSLDKLKEEISQEIKMNKYITDHIPEVTVSEDEIKESYDRYSEQVEDAPSYDEVKDQIQQNLKDQKSQQHVSELIKKLRDEIDIEILI